MAKKHRGLPQGMTYAQKLAQEKRLQKAVEDAALNETVRVRADIQSQQMLWLCVVSMAEAFGLGPKRVSDFFGSLQSVSEWVEDLEKSMVGSMRWTSCGRKLNRSAAFLSTICTKRKSWRPKHGTRKTACSSRYWIGKWSKEDKDD